MPETIHLCLCGDAHVRPGLHVALGSAARALMPDVELRVTVLDLGLDADEPAALRETLRRAGRPFALDLVPADFSPLGDLGTVRRFYGSWAPYLKVLLPEQLPQLSRVVYLDTDTVVCTDLSALFATDLGERIGGFVEEGPISTAFENQYFLRHGFTPSEWCFNSGVMLLDLDRWRREGITQHCIEIIRRDGAELLSADQTVLNLALHGRTLALPRHYNRLTYPTSPPVRPESAEGIYHLVGRPKPWEPFGELFSQQGPLFTHHLDQTALAGWRSWRHFDLDSLWRMMRLARSYWRALTRRVKS